MIRFGERPKALPAVLTRDEVAQLLACVPGPIGRLLLQTVYACGLWASEVPGQRGTGMDRSRMLLRVRHDPEDREVLSRDRGVPVGTPLACLASGYFDIRNGFKPSSPSRAR